MGIWTWLKRWDEDTFAAHRRRQSLEPRGLTGSADPAHALPAAPEPAEEIHTHRVWHALHVALTGQEAGGAPPASHVLWTTRDAQGVTFSEAEFVHPPQLVRDIADWLGGVEFEDAVEELYAAIEQGAFVYSFKDWEGNQDMVQSGALRRVFDDVVRFYGSAAAAGQLIEVSRG